MTYEEYLKFFEIDNMTYEKYKEILEETNVTYEKYLEILGKRKMTYDEYKETVEMKINNRENYNRIASRIFDGKWNMHVIFELNKNKALRFGQLKKIIPGVTNTMLTNTLRELETFGVVSRTQYNSVPPHVEYSITENGKKLIPVFYEMAKWSMKYL